MKYKRCKHIKTNGEQCKARAMKGTQYCFFHNPKTKTEVSEAGREGGERSKIKILPKVPLNLNYESVHQALKANSANILPIANPKNFCHKINTCFFGG